MSEKALEIDLAAWKETLEELDKIHAALFTTHGISKGDALVAILLDRLIDAMEETGEEGDNDKPWEDNAT